ncbi:cytochrome b [Tsuneonella sp. SYSU-LHT278]|uniref:cytochrome b n=1 Tax=Tsuneonella sediminis TaxID=3416089 RepID=UPI003F7A4F6A
MNQPERTRYSRVAMLLHWLIAIAVIAQWRIAESAEHAASETAGRAIMANHFSLGVTTLMLVLLRLGWRFVAPNPPLAAHLAQWERWLSRTTHTLFYVLLVVMPLAGWMAMSKYGAPVSVWGLFALPPLPVAPDPDGAKAIFGAHATAGMVLLGLLALHVLGTLKHTAIDKDGNLFRMLPFGTPRA